MTPLAPPNLPAERAIITCTLCGQMITEPADAVFDAQRVERRWNAIATETMQHLMQHHQPDALTAIATGTALTGYMMLEHFTAPFLPEMRDQVRSRIISMIAEPQGAPPDSVKERRDEPGEVHGTCQIEI